MFMATVLNIYAVSYKLGPSAKNEPENTWGYDLGITYHPAKTEEEVREWFKKEGGKNVRAFRPGFRESSIVSIEKIICPKFTVLAFSDLDLRD